jgi:hypothetical protein
MSEHCLGITKNGEPCRVTANLVDGYCRIHRSMRDDAPSSGGRGASGDEPDMILERAPETGHPRYVPCADEPRRRWALIAVVTVAALLALAVVVFFAARPKSK